MEISKVNRTQLSTRSSGLSRQEEIKILLAKFAVRRQAQIGEAEYDIYSASLLSYSLTDIEMALNLLSSKPRAEGQTAFPEEIVILEAVRGIARTRRAAEEEATKAKEWEAYKARVEAERQELMSNPEEWNKTLNDAAERLGMGRKKVIDTTPVMQTCPHCSRELPVAPNLRFWRVLELREYADLLERNQAIAAANRAAMMAQQAVPAEGIV